MFGRQCAGAVLSTAIYAAWNPLARLFTVSTGRPCPHSTAVSF